MAMNRILLVDDDHDTQKLMRLVMNHYGVNLTVSSNAEQALAVLSQDTFDLIILDLVLEEGMDGYRLLHAIREQGYQTPCVAVSAYYNHETTLDTLQYGFNGFIPKPFEANSLLDTLNKIFNSAVS